MKKKTTILLLSLGILAFVIDRNRKQSGIIRNQQLTIDGLMSDVKNLSYHLGKKQNITNTI